MNKTIFLYANPEFDERYKCGISRLYRIFFREHGLNLEIIDDEFLKSNIPKDDFPDILVIAGGDGTFHRVINTIPSPVLTKYNLGIIPGGTANEFAKSIGLPRSFEDAARVIAQNNKVIISKKGVINGKYHFATGFLYGIACKALEETSVKSKFYLGSYAYQLPGLFSISNYCDFVKKFNINSTGFSTGYLLINNASLLSKNIPANSIKAENKNLFSFVYLYPNLNIGDLLRLIVNNQIGENILLDPMINYRQIDDFSLEFEGMISFMLDGEVYKLASPLKFEHSEHEMKIIV